MNYSQQLVDTQVALARWWTHIDCEAVRLHIPARAFEGTLNIQQLITWFIKYSTDKSADPALTDFPHIALNNIRERGFRTDFNAIMKGENIT